MKMLKTTKSKKNLKNQIKSIFYLDQSLNNIISLKPNSNYSVGGISLLYPEYNTQKYKWEDNELSFIRLNNKSIISSKFDLLKLDVLGIFFIFLLVSTSISWTQKGVKNIWDTMDLNYINYY